MKIAPLLVATASSLETSTSASSLLAAVGKRNVTHMEALVQGLAEESIKEPAWKFDKDIQDALHTIRDMFVKSIQDALKDQHKEDQTTHNCETKSCFAKCEESYNNKHTACREMINKCEETSQAHDSCRESVYGLYKAMGKACGELHGFEPPKVTCPEEKCICPDLRKCHLDSDGDGKCEATSGDCKSDEYGTWLQAMIGEFNAAYARWNDLHSKCTNAYHAFLLADLECDGIQKAFERCMCAQEVEESNICSRDFVGCKTACWAIYEENVPNLQCQEKDRKIDWSATKKIECYLDILLHEYTKDELVAKCGSADCVNVAREKDYKHCATICPSPDYKGDWTTATCHPSETKEVDGVLKTVAGKVTIESHGHEPRKEHGQYFLGDSEYECDENGPEVHTDHRTSDRQAEGRCTEHLDIDFQVPNPPDCRPNNARVCDDDFHCKYYAKFDEEAQISVPDINDPCVDADEQCWPSPQYRTCVDGAAAYEAGVSFSATKMFKPKEHSHAWAYNRCPCQECNHERPEVPKIRDHCHGAHSLGGAAYGL